jgi:membrane-bound lytic murein transglycosylase B
MQHHYDLAIARKARWSCLLGVLAMFFTARAIARPRGRAPRLRAQHRWSVFLATLAALGALTNEAHAQIYQRVTPEGVVVFTHAPRGGGWRPVHFPARRNRAYRRGHAPRSDQPIAQRLASYDHYLREAAALYQLPHAYLRAVAHVESRFDPSALSVDGAMGLMQLMPFTARAMGVSAPHDPKQNAFGGARFLRVLANKFNGDLTLTTAAYNAGAGAVQKYRGVPPYAETQRYVGRVLYYYRAYATTLAQAQG